MSSIAIILWLGLCNFVGGTGDGEGIGFALKRLLRCGFYPVHVLDVGANTGTWTITVKKIFPNASYFLIEGNDQHQQELSKLNFPFEIAIVGGARGQSIFYRSRRHMGTGNSIFRENTLLFKTAEEALLNVTTIDSIVERRKLGPFSLIKLDIQGSELSALQGAQVSLKHTEVVTTEVSIMNYNQGSPSFFDLHRFMESNDFSLFDFFDESRHAQKGMVVQIDVMWVRKTSSLWSEACTGFPTPIHFHNVPKGTPSKRSRSHDLPL